MNKIIAPTTTTGKLHALLKFLDTKIDLAGRASATEKAILLDAYSDADDLADARDNLARWEGKIAAFEIARQEVLAIIEGY